MNKILTFTFNKNNFIDNKISLIYQNQSIKSGFLCQMSYNDKRFSIIKQSFSHLGIRDTPNETILYINDILRTNYLFMNTNYLKNIFNAFELFSNTQVEQVITTLKDE